MAKEHTETSESGKRRRRPTQAERRAHTREELLDAAYAVFVRRGFAAANLDEIAEAAGLSKGALYYNFSGKEDLFLALVEQRLARRAANLREGVEAARGALDGARPRGERDDGDWVRLAIGALPLDRDWTLLFFEFVCHAARRPEVAAAFADRLAELRDLGSQALGELAEHAEVDLPAPAGELSAALSALANGAAIDALLSADEGPARELLTTAAVRMLRPEPPRA